VTPITVSYTVDRTLPSTQGSRRKRHCGDHPLRRPDLLAVRREVRRNLRVVYCVPVGYLRGAASSVVTSTRCGFLDRLMAVAVVPVVSVAAVLFLGGSANAVPSAGTLGPPTSSPSATPGVTATTTTLVVSPSRAFAGVAVIFLANVAPHAAVGGVQFIMDGTTALAASVPVTAAGCALLIDSLPEGTHSLTAVFTPTNRANYAPSMSPPLSLMVGPSSQTSERPQ